MLNWFEVHVQVLYHTFSFQCMECTKIVQFFWFFSALHVHKLIKSIWGIKHLFESNQQAPFSKIIPEKSINIMFTEEVRSYENSKQIEEKMTFDFDVDILFSRHGTLFQWNHSISTWTLFFYIVFWNKIFCGDQLFSIYK